MSAHAMEQIQAEMSRPATAFHRHRMLWASDRAPTVTIGVGAVADGGVFVVGSGGSVTTLVAPTSRWTKTWIVTVLLGALVPVVPLVLLATGADTADLGLVMGALLVTWLFGTGMSLFQAWRRVATSIVFDRPRQIVAVHHGSVAALDLPFAMLSALRIEVRADKNYGDDYNVMGVLPGAALWIHQLSSHNAATAFATHLAAATGLAFDPQLTRRA